MNMFDVKKMGEQIAHLRIGNKYTQEQLSEKLKVSPQAISKWENGKAVPEMPLLYEMSRLFNCSVDRILDPQSGALCTMDFNYEFIVKPRIPVADYSGPEWPKSISIASLSTALKLFLGLEQRRDSRNCQINDDEEYILQSAITNVCFGYSYAPDEWIRDSFLIYGLDYEIYSQADYSQDEFISLACKQIEHGYPVIVIPKEYTDNIFAIGFSEHGQTLKGLGFLEGDDQKNASINFDQLNRYAGWYKVDCDLMLVKPLNEKMPLVEACTNALFNGMKLLLNNSHCGEDKMQGYGMVIYQNWCDLLKEENKRNADQIDCVFPHAFIHYENKLRTKQFFELCINIIPDIDKELMTLAISQYDEILSFATEIATIAHQRNSFSEDSLKEKRNYIIEMLRRSSEQEELALSYIQKALVNIRK
ncbi:MAG: helix-turn-helix domain-containing protein [Lachnospiraceae bacterium]|nr:helix-turn-helix domain-containing protein [Lachnospiraceae bacterium]